jgi:colanic acid biosynthesis glycosyl transferase WcaI
MKILVISQYYDPEPLPKPAQLARALAQKGHDVTVITGFPNYPYGKLYDGYKIRFWEKMESGGIRVFRVPLFPDHSRSIIRRFLNYVSFSVTSAIAGIVLGRRMDVMVVFHPPLTMGVTAWVVSKLRDIPYVYCISDLWPELMIASGVLSNQSIIRALFAMESFVYEKATIVAPVSSGMSDRLLQKGVTQNKLEILTDWANEEIFYPVSPDYELRKRLGIGNDFTIMFAGQLGIAQGLDTLLDATYLLKGSIPLNVVIVGDGIEKERLMNKATDYGLDNVYFVGRFPEKDMPKLYALADGMLVHLAASDVFSMSVPSKIYSYMACGRPVLAAVAGTTAEIVTTFRCGVICEPGNPSEMAESIRALSLLSPQSRESMGANGREAFLMNYSVECGVDEYERVLLRLASRSGFV